jgi:hypothetical protein
MDFKTFDFKILKCSKRPIGKNIHNTTYNLHILNSSLWLPGYSLGNFTPLSFPAKKFTFQHATCTKKLGFESGIFSQA